jgi:hypothetical protein
MTDPSGTEIGIRPFVDLPRTAGLKGLQGIRVQNLLSFADYVKIEKVGMLPEA